ncbi:MAG: SIS domain-containing protein [Firmicutes bacterium]|nr:SIS domain-containing protein [Bacillota bacterium]
MSANNYLEQSLEFLNKVRATQSDNICQAAALCAQSIKSGGLIHVFGTGHSQMVAEEAYSRAGSLLLINAILEPGLLLHEGGAKSSAVEKVPGLARALLVNQPLHKGETIIIVSNSGRNPVPIETAMLAREQGLNVVAITSLAHSQAVSSRHESGKKLYELADVVIDNCGIPGDAILRREGVGAPFCATSSLTGIYIIQALIAETVEILADSGLEAPVLMSGNLDESAEYNAKMIEKYLERLPQLAAYLRR